MDRFSGCSTLCQIPTGDIPVGICAGVDDDGALLLRTDTGMQRILAGDVSLRPLTGDAA